MNGTVLLDPSLYTTHNLNIISSTKINQKVTQILRIFGVLPPVSSAQKETETTQPKPVHDASAVDKTCTVVTIRAKANVASKLISIVEILKRDLARRATERHETAENAAKDGKAHTTLSKAPISRLYQYTSVTTIPTEVKIKPPQPKSTQPPSTTPTVPEDPQQQGTKRKRPVDSSQDSSTTTAIAAARTSKKQKQDDTPEDEPKAPEEDEDEDEDFQVMATARVTAAGSTGKDAGAQPTAPETPVTTQIRDIPLLTVYLCSKPVDVLEKMFGEQGG